MSGPIDLKKKKLDLQAFMDAGDTEKTHVIYISKDIELDMMEAVHNLTRKLPFMVLMLRRGEYVFNYNGQRYTVTVDLSYTGPYAAIGLVAVHNFKGISHVRQEAQ